MQYECAHEESECLVLEKVDSKFKFNATTYTVTECMAIATIYQYKPRRGQEG